MTMRFKGVMLFCENIRELTRFYEEVLGLRRDPTQSLPPRRFVTLLDDAGETALNLHSGTKPNGGRAKLMFSADAIEPLYQRLRSHGRRPRKPRHIPNGTMTYDFADAEGIGSRCTGRGGGPTVPDRRSRRSQAASQKAR